MLTLRSELAPQLFQALVGSVLDLHFTSLNPRAQFAPIDEQTDDDVMHLNRFGKADRLTRQPFQMFALNKFWHL
jgi:hypothetical protein